MDRYVDIANNPYPADAFQLERAKNSTVTASIVHTAHEPYQVERIEIVEDDPIVTHATRRSVNVILYKEIF